MRSPRQSLNILHNKMLLCPYRSTPLLHIQHIQHIQHISYIQQVSVAHKTGLCCTHKSSECAFSRHGFSVLVQKLSNTRGHRTLVVWRCSLRLVVVRGKFKHSNRLAATMSNISFEGRPKSGSLVCGAAPMYAHCASLPFVNCISFVRGLFVADKVCSLALPPAGTPQGLCR